MQKGASKTVGKLLTVKPKIQSQALSSKMNLFVKGGWVMAIKINGFELISSFFSFVFSNQEKGIKPYHISLYVFLWNQNNRLLWVEWFKCPYDVGMMGSGINSKHTYYKALAELQEWGLIQYTKGINFHQAPRIKLAVQKCTSTVPQCEPLPIPQLALQAELLPAPLLGREIKLLTNNLKKVTENIDSILDFLNYRENNELQNSTIHLNENSDSQRVQEATKKIADFFGIGEISQTSSYMKIGNFVRFQEQKGNMELLAKQFTAYRKAKEKNGFKHSWMKYIGTAEESYEDGAWNIHDWSKQLKTDEQPTTDYQELKKRTKSLQGISDKN